MKLTPLQLICLLLCASGLAAAQSTSTSFQVTAKVMTSCAIIVDQHASFVYSALNGTGQVQPAIVNVYCTKGTLSTVLRYRGGPLTLKDSQGHPLQAELKLSKLKSGTGTGLYAGATALQITYDPVAPAGQWAAPNGTYLGAYTLTVTF